MTIFSFESGIPANFAIDRHSRLSISKAYYKDGNASLQWDYTEGSAVVITEPIGYRPFQEGTKNQARDSFVIWIYNTAAVEGNLLVEFGRDGQTVDCFFQLGLNFKGWRTAWVAYERDMKGNPHPEMNTITIRMPKGVQPGTLFIDQMMLNTPIDPRFHTRDFQVPLVNLGADVSANAHWLALYAFEQLTPPHEIPASVRQEEKDALQLMNERFESLCLKKRRVSQEEIELLQQRFAEYGIMSQVGMLTGRPIELFFDHYPPPLKEELKRLSNGVQLSEITHFLLETAVCFRSCEEEEQRAVMQAMFISVLDHMEDQGWTYGSSQGTVHHFGYNFRDYYPAVFLMRAILKEAGILERTQRTMRWFSGVGRTHTPLAEVEGNIDIYNTTLHGMLASLLIMDDTSEKIRDLKAFRDWLSQSLLPAPGLRAAYKIDGSAYHHVNHYPAYAVGGFQGVTPVMYVLKGTPFRVSREAHETIRNALLAMRLYSNKREWLISLSARHPTGKWALDPEPFVFLADSGTPDGRSEVDTEVAAAYLRLLDQGERTEAARRFEAMGIIAEPEPNGHWTMNYAALAIHRRDSWLAGMRGHSRYLWANETYVNANLYGRYISHGHLQIMSRGEPVNHQASGYQHDGWDWNRWPGTTTVHKPLEELRANVCNVDTFSGFEEMLLSDETFAGGLHLEGHNGMFAMKLHEHPKYEGSHRARKSAFFFDNRIICLGSGIENDNEACVTETTLFQNHLPAIHDPLWLNEAAPVTEFPFSQKKQLDNPTWILDNKGNGYYIPAGQTVAVSKATQHSKHQSTGADTQGDFAAAWLEHGTSPNEGSYEYTVLVDIDYRQVERFYKQMEHSDTALYKVLRRDRSAHVVYDAESCTTAYALFEADEHLGIGHLTAIDTPAMVMIREDGGTLIMSAVDPDLRLYEGIETDQYDRSGIQREVSVYSRKWVHAESMVHTMRITLKGQWMLSSPGQGIQVLAGEGDSSVVELTSKDGLPMAFILVPCV
jgi:chondroitin-sulfate-ABC endolyase/exolyase